MAQSGEAAPHEVDVNEPVSIGAVEEFLYTHPEISDVQVYGVPDEKYGEQVEVLSLVGDVALEARQWTLAKQAYLQALKQGGDDERQNDERNKSSA